MDHQVIVAARSPPAATNSRGHCEQQGRGYYLDGAGEERAGRLRSAWAQCRRLYHGGDAGTRPVKLQRGPCTSDECGLGSGHKHGGDTVADIQFARNTGINLAPSASPCLILGNRQSGSPPILALGRFLSWAPCRRDQLNHG